METQSRRVEETSIRPRGDWNGVLTEGWNKEKASSRWETPISRIHSLCLRCPNPQNPHHQLDTICINRHDTSTLCAPHTQSPCKHRDHTSAREDTPRYKHHSQTVQLSYRNSRSFPFCSTSCSPSCFDSKALQDYVAYIRPFWQYQFVNRKSLFRVMAGLLLSDFASTSSSYVGFISL